MADKRTGQVDAHEVRGDAGGSCEAGVHDGDLGVALAEVGQQRPEGPALSPHLRVPVSELNCCLRDAYSACSACAGYIRGFS